MIIAGIDVGSNSVRMLIAELIDGKIANILHTGRGITRLGGDLSHTGELNPEGVEKTLQLFETFNEAIEKYNVDKVLAVATSAVREAKDSIAFIKRANDIGIPLQAISGDDEAYYTYLGVSSLFGGVDCIIYDIGGGSSELIFVKDSKIVKIQSIPIGVVKLADRFDFSEPLDGEALELCEEYIRSNFQIAFNEGTFGIETIIGTAGSVTSVAAIDLKMDKYDPTIINGYTLDWETLDRIEAQLSSMNAEARLSIVGVERGREDLLIPGIMIIKGIMAHAGVKRSSISDYGLREGLIISAGRGL
ncbi:MAG: Ppx/GppA family phosphatase [Deferribacteraceae bacterium]|jgi:exopolyphosphatase/guanosine-5'-triphosphate,3'-diphosphate pyrophosphatase|nr:Ppx/GppA family phosphatase [Deferribacteraceae bacterium]